MKLFTRGKYYNTVLNWHRAPAKEFLFYAEAYWKAAKVLCQNKNLDQSPIASFDACVIVYLYRHALELFLKEILIGRGSELIDPAMSPEQVVNANHDLTKLLPDVRRIFAECGWEDDFGSNAALTFDDFTAIVEELQTFDPSSYAFRYPVNKKSGLQAQLPDHFTFRVREFAATMDEVLNTLYGACYMLPDIANDQAEAAYEASIDAMSGYEPPDYEPPDYEPPDYEPPDYEPPDYEPPDYEPPDY